MRKDDEDQEDFAETVDLSSLDLLVNATPDDLATIMANSGKQALMQLGIEHENNLVNQVDANSLAYAKSRSAEMVGKQWDGDQLVDNPDAEWVITDATRDELRSLVAQVQSGDLKLTDLPQAIQDATAFSPERAELIARTEIITANSQGTLSGFKAARSIGVVIKKKWWPDKNACEVCLGNADDGAIDLDDNFSSGDDAPAAHPNCKCALISDIGDEDEADEDE